MSLKNDFWAAHNNLASIYYDSGDIQKAISKYKWIVEKNPNYIEARGNLALALKVTGSYDAAIREYERTFRVIKSSAIEFHMAATLLTLGRFDQGWERYKSRWAIDPLDKVLWPFEKTGNVWEGEKDKKIVLWGEQGIGDHIIFLSLVPEAFKKSKALSVYIDQRLISICERSLPDIRFLPDEKALKKEKFDYHSPLGSLPRLFRNSEEDFKRALKGYLKADPKRVESLRDELGLKGKKVVGISWKSVKATNKLKKSMELRDFCKAFKDLDITLVNLQYGDVDKEIREFKKETGIEVLQCASVDNRNDLDGLAALIEVCDLVVSTSNVTIHLAGALGKETWVLLPYVAHFWWLLDRTDSIWYPSLKLYRQNKSGNWNFPIRDLTNDLKRIW